MKMAKVLRGLVLVLLMITTQCPMLFNPPKAHAYLIWTNIGRTGDAGVSALAKDTDRDILYAGATGVWAYNGASWTDTGGGVSTYTITALAYDPENEVLYAGTYNHGVWSYDGTTWSDTGGGVSTYSVIALACDPEHGLLYAGTSGWGVWSFDGSLWTITGTGWPSGASSLLYVPQHHRLYASTGNDVSEYDGSSWSSTGGPVGNQGAGYLAFSPRDNAVYTTAYSYSSSATYLYGYNGSAWNEVSRFPVEGTPANRICYDTAHDYLYCGGFRFNGTEWENTIKNNLDGGQTVLLYDGEDDLIYAGSHTGVVRTRSTSWQDPTLYLAEGCTRPGYDTWLCVLTVSFPFTLEVDYLTQYGLLKTVAYDIPGSSRYTINVNGEIGPDLDVSMRMRLKLDPSAGVNADQYCTYIAVERPMYFSSTGLGHDPWTGGHVNVASALPLSDTCYFAEGTTRAGFEEWICVLNPNDQAVTLDFNYMVQGEGLVTRQEILAANSRGTWNATLHLGEGKDTSLQLVSDLPVLAERPMYFSYTGTGHEPWAGGHVITGARQATSEQRGFAFAPIAYVPTIGRAETWICLQNPNTVPAEVRISISTHSGYQDQAISIAPQQRTTLFFKDLIEGWYGVDGSIDPSAFYVQTTDAKLPIMVERPVYISFDEVTLEGAPEGSCRGGFVSDGVKGYVSDYDRSVNKFAEGYTGPGFFTWLALNHGKMPASNNVYIVRCYLPGGKSEECWFQGSEVGNPQSHETWLWRVNDFYPDTDISFLPLVSNTERIMVFAYGSSTGGIWTGTHGSMGLDGEKAGQ